MMSCWERHRWPQACTLSCPCRLWGNVKVILLCNMFTVGLGCSTPAQALAVLSELALLLPAVQVKCDGETEIVAMSSCPSLALIL